MGRREEEQQVHTCLGNANYSHRDFKQSAEYHRLSMNIANELGDRSSVARAYRSWSDDYSSLNDKKQTVEYGTLILTISIEEITGEEAAAYRRLGNAFLVLGYFEQALSYYEQCPLVATEVGIYLAKDARMDLLGLHTKALVSLKAQLNITRDIDVLLPEVMGNITERGVAYGNIDVAYESLGEFKQAKPVSVFQRAIH